MELHIPANFDFSTLRLTYNPITDDLSYDVNLLSEMIRLRSDEDVALIDEDLLWGILLTLYRYHLDNGGKSDAVVQQFLDALVDENVMGSC
ncbi:MAG: hypothetical protein GKR77_05740 [Legionellales bacterium]|nr:hypothetical protein [Legionellales bacterium]